MINKTILEIIKELYTVYPVSTTGKEYYKSLINVLENTTLNHEEIIKFLADLEHYKTVSVDIMESNMARKYSYYLEEILRIYNLEQ